MRKRIWRLANDEFDTPSPQVLVKPDRIAVEAAEASHISGSFTVISLNEIPLRGMVYSSNPYVVCTTPQFEGLQNVIAYEVHLPKALAGDCLRGHMTIVANQVTLEIPYEITYTEAKLMSSIGQIKEIRQFALLARDHWQEALNLFYSDAFAHWIIRQDQRLRLLYRAYRRGALSGVNLEHFLVDAGLKEALVFGLPDETRKYAWLREDQEDHIHLLKRGWGHGEIQLTCRGDFISLEKKRISSEDFLGQTADVPYLLDAKKLRAGVNYAVIQMQTNGLVHQLSIQATRRDFPSAIPGIRQSLRTLIVRVMRDYESYRLGRMSRPEWCHRWLRDLEDLRRLDSDRDVFWQLLQTMALIENGQTEEALDLIGGLKGKIADKNSPEWGLLLYLYCNLSEDRQNRRELIRQIDVIFRRHRDRADLFCCLLRTEEKETAEKYAEISEEAARVHSPLLYLEAYDLLREEPYLLTEADDFAFGLLSWVRSRRAFTAALVDRLVKILATSKTCSAAWTRIFMGAVWAYPSRENLSALIAYLLLEPNRSARAQSWYERAVDEGVNVPGLYEAYMMSMPQDTIRPIPPLLARYFLINNRLPQEKQALLYANIVSFQKRDPKTYEAYRNSLDRFAERMMIEGRIDDNIAIIYNDYLDRITPSETIARAMAPLLFIHKILCTAEGARRVLVYHQALTEPVIASVADHAAYLPLYGGDRLLVLEDENGAITEGEKLLGVEPLLDIDRFYDRLAPLAPDSIPYLLHGLSLNPRMPLNRPQMLAMLSSYKLREDYLAPYYPAMSECLLAAGQESVIEEHFRKVTDLTGMNRDMRKYVLTSWIHSGQYHKVYLALQDFTVPGLAPEDLAGLVSAVCLGEDASDSRDFGLSLCGFLLDCVGEGVSSAQWDERLIAFMLEGFVGTTDRMMILWELAGEAKLDRFALAERILVQSLYTEDIPKGLSEVFDYYRGQRPNTKIMEAYQNFFAHRYLLDVDQKDHGIPEHIFFYIYDEYARRRSPSQSCMLALMKRLCYSKKLTNAEFALLDRLIGQALSQRIRFSFMQKVDHSLLMKYQLYDKAMIEYQSDPQQTIRIRYSLPEGGYREELMPEIYCGLYVKQMVLFQGQTVDYLIWDDLRGKDPAVSGKISCQLEAKIEEEAAYNRLNRMEDLLGQGNLEQGIEEMMDYRMQENITSKLFSLL
nr:DUF5717 family protein [Shuttleworthia satelles]